MSQTGFTPQLFDYLKGSADHFVAEYPDMGIMVMETPAELHAVAERVFFDAAAGQTLQKAFVVTAPNNAALLIGIDKDGEHITALANTRQLMDPWGAIFNPPEIPEPLRNPNLNAEAPPNLGAVVNGLTLVTREFCSAAGLPEKLLSNHIMLHPDLG